MVWPAVWVIDATEVRKALIKRLKRDQRDSFSFSLQLYTDKCQLYTVPQRRCTKFKTIVYSTEILLEQWQHRKCNTGITQREYKEAVQSGLPLAIDWCWLCALRLPQPGNMSDGMLDEYTIPVRESTRIEEEIPWVSNRLFHRDPS